MSEKSKKSVVASKLTSAEASDVGRRTYASQFRREAVELIAREGLSVAEAARRLGVNQTLLRSWKLKFQAEGGGHAANVALDEFVVSGNCGLFQEQQ